MVLVGRSADKLSILETRILNNHFSEYKTDIVSVWAKVGGERLICT